MRLRMYVTEMLKNLWSGIGIKQGSRFRRLKIKRVSEDEKRTEVNNERYKATESKEL